MPSRPRDGTHPQRLPAAGQIQRAQACKPPFVAMVEAWVPACSVPGPASSVPGWVDAQCSGARPPHMRPLYHTAPGHAVPSPSRSHFGSSQTDYMLKYGSLRYKVQNSMQQAGPTSFGAVRYAAGGGRSRGHVPPTAEPLRRGEELPGWLVGAAPVTLSPAPGQRRWRTRTCQGGGVVLEMVRQRAGSAQGRGGRAQRQSSLFKPQS